MMKKIIYLLASLCISLQTIAATSNCGIKTFPDYQIEYCLFTGNGPLLVLEGSQGNDFSIWPNSFIQSLKQFSSVLIYNRVGYGQSRYYQTYTQPITAKEVASRLHALLTSLHIKQPVVLVGHSIGSIYVQYFARRYPQKTAALILLDGDSADEPIVNSPFISKSPFKAGSMDDLESRGFNLSMNQVNALPPLSPNIPLLVISATNHQSDPTTEKQWMDLQKKIAAESTRSTHVIAKGSGHFVYIDMSDFVINNIKAFLKNNKLIIQ
jgi:pimeloyl-ACP methyl ester carboxylesterase